MRLDLYRYSDDGKSTLGLFFIDNKFSCYTLEDTFRKEKVYGETRIPSGRYDIKLRDEGQKNIRYKTKYGNKHHGMLWLQDVPDFEWIYIHKGNEIKHTLGCILVGDQINNNTVNNGFVGASTRAYERIYEKISDCILSGESVFIQIHDEGKDSAEKIKFKPTE